MRRTLTVGLAAFAAMVVLGVFTGIHQPGFDRGLHDWSREHVAGHLALSTMRALTHLGDTAVVLALAVLASLALRPNRRAWAVPVAAVFGWLCTRWGNWPSTGNGRPIEPGRPVIRRIPADTRR